MDNHPLCKCGNPVEIKEHMVPCYDDGGGLDSFDIYVSYYETCMDCVEEFHVNTFSKPLDDDDLPF